MFTQVMALPLVSNKIRIIKSLWSVVYSDCPFVLTLSNTVIVQWKNNNSQLHQKSHSISF